MPINAIFSRFYWFLHITGNLILILLIPAYIRQPSLNSIDPWIYKQSSLDSFDSWIQKELFSRLYWSLNSKGKYHSILLIPAYKRQSSLDSIDLCKNKGQSSLDSIDPEIKKAYLHSILLILEYNIQSSLDPRDTWI